MGYKWNEDILIIDNVFKKGNYVDGEEIKTFEKNIFFKFSIKYHHTHIVIVFNLAQLSVICISFTDFGFLLAYFLKSLSLKILFIVLTMFKKPIFLAKNKLTSTSFDALTIVGVIKPKFKHLVINFIEGKRFVLTF